MQSSSLRRWPSVSVLAACRRASPRPRAATRSPMRRSRAMWSTRPTGAVTITTGAIAGRTAAICAAGSCQRAMAKAGRAQARPVGFQGWDFRTTPRPFRRGRARPRGNSRARPADASRAAPSTCRVRKNPVSAEAVGEVLRRRLGRRLAVEKRRQPQQPVLPRLARQARHRAARFRRHVDEVLARRRSPRRLRGRARSRARSAAAARTHHRGRGEPRIGEAVEHVIERGVDVRMRIALRQQAAKRRQMRHAVERLRGCQVGRRAQVEAFDRVEAEMLVEPRPPGRAARDCPAAAPAAGASRRRRAPGRDGGRARASSVRGWRSPRRGA